MTSPTFEFTALSSASAAALRSKGGEIYIADEPQCYPCRQCLQDANVGEELILLSYNPFGSKSPYRSASPIFLHRHDCGDPTSDDHLPDQLAIRQLSVRSFDADEMMIDAAVIDGADLPTTIDAMFADELSHMLHVHNAQRGCYAVRVDRAR